LQKYQRCGRVKNRPFTKRKEERGTSDGRNARYCFTGYFSRLKRNIKFSMKNGTVGM